MKINDEKEKVEDYEGRRQRKKGRRRKIQIT